MLNPDGIVAVASGGTDHSRGLADLMSLPMVTVLQEAKKHGTGRLIYGKLQPGSNCLAVDDVFNTGKSIFTAINHLRATGLVVTHALCITDYGLSSTRAGFTNLKVTPICLVNLPIILSEAYRLRQIDEPSYKILQSWQQNLFR